jgi:uncharacterized membrane protein
MKRRIIAALGILLAGCADNAGNAVDEMPAVASNNAAAPSSPDIIATETPQANDAAPQKAGACLTQDNEPLRITPVKAIGTEPFWGAQVEGRCVTYSTPEDQRGTRIWTRFNPGPDGGVWVGSLDGQPFKLITRLRPNCSDGMSDRSYPLEAILTVRGEERRGCASPN